METIKKILKVFIKSVDFIATVIGYMTIAVVIVAAIQGKLTISNLDGDVIWTTSYEAQQRMKDDNTTEVASDR